jgi:hypothetical protein
MVSDYDFYSAESLNLNTTTASVNLLIYIFRFRSYLVTNIGRILAAKDELMIFCEAYRKWWANALVKETPIDCTVVIEGVGAR